MVCVPGIPCFKTGLEWSPSPSNYHYALGKQSTEVIILKAENQYCPVLRIWFVSLSTVLCVKETRWLKVQGHWELECNPNQLLHCYCYPLSIPHIIYEWIWNRGVMIPTGENQMTGRKTCPSGTSSTTNSSLHGEKAVTNHNTLSPKSQALFIVLNDSVSSAKVNKSPTFSLLKALVVFKCFNQTPNQN
jgi:hypothetical protein